MWLEKRKTRGIMLVKNYGVENLETPTIQYTDLIKNDKVTLFELIEDDKRNELIVTITSIADDDFTGIITQINYYEYKKNSVYTEGQEIPFKDYEIDSCIRK